MASTELSNLDIEHRLRWYKDFGGCISKDQTNLLKHGKIYVLNMDSTNGAGTHWVVLDNRSIYYLYYFDSFGIAPPESIVRYAKSLGKSIIYNAEDVQAISSDRCGWYCVYVVEQLESGKSFNDIISSFTSSVRKNEEFLKNYFHTK
jgi:hypothetical protein